MADTVCLVDELFKIGAVLKGHFLLSSGRHSDTYIEKFRLLERPEMLETFCLRLASYYRKDGVDLVVGPTTGGALVAYETARALGAQARYLEWEGNQRALRRGADLRPDSRVLLVDDVLTTGRSIDECLPVLEQVRLVGIGVLIRRGDPRLEWRVPLHEVVRFDAVDWPAEECPLCKSGEPIVKPGSRGLSTLE